MRLKSATDGQGAATNAGKILEEVTLKESSITQTAGEISTKVTEVNKKVTEANTAATNAKNSATSASGLPELHPVKRARLQIRQLMQNNLQIMRRKSSKM